MKASISLIEALFDSLRNPLRSRGPTGIRVLPEACIKIQIYLSEPSNSEDHSAKISFLIDIDPSLYAIYAAVEHVQRGGMTYGSFVIR